MESNLLRQAHIFQQRIHVQGWVCDINVTKYSRNTAPRNKNLTRKKKLTRKISKKKKKINKNLKDFPIISLLRCLK